jgi:hypothetical protein
MIRVESQTTQFPQVENQFLQNDLLEERAMFHLQRPEVYHLQNQVEATTLQLLLQGEMLHLQIEVLKIKTKNLLTIT